MKFNIYGGMKSENFNLHTQQIELETLEEARKFAREFAHSLYYWNPTRDILEIMNEENIDEDEAESIFYNEMIDSTIYYFEEIVEINGEVVELVRHEQ